MICCAVIGCLGDRADCDCARCLWRVFSTKRVNKPMMLLIAASCFIKLLDVYFS